MKKLSELLPKYPHIPDITINSIKTNSREIEKGDLFVCIKGVNIDRHDFIADAVEKGAVAIITAKDIDNLNVPYIKVANPDALLDELYSRFYDYPQKKLQLIGITGTDGKTSTATIIQSLIGDKRCGYIGTNGYSCHAFKRKTDNTTPAKDKLYRYLSEFVNEGIEYVAMETSSEAFYYHRLDGFKFACGAITNITSEHLNTHKTLENYIACKKQLFHQIDKDGTAILNFDDQHYQDVLDATDKVLTYGRNPQCDLYIAKEDLRPDCSNISFIYQDKTYKFQSPLLGSFNSENLAAAILTLLSLGFTMNEILKNIGQLKISGRMEMIKEGQDFYCLVDYAHTPNGISRLLTFIQSLKNIRRKIVVIGQAGERDPYKRKDVGRIVADYADLAIFTYEDPRNENLDNIFKMMTEDILDKDNYIIIKDRHEAIEYAINQANRDDMVMILGKGNETYQRIGNEIIYFNDIEEAKKAIQKNKEMK